MENDEEVFKYIENKILNKLPVLENVKYNVCLYSEYNNRNNSFNIKCTCNITKTLKTELKNFKINLDIYDSYIDIIADNLTEQILGIPIQKDYIEINGVKYYPKEE